MNPLGAKGQMKLPGPLAPNAGPHAHLVCPLLLPGAFSGWNFGGALLLPSPGGQAPPRLLRVPGPLATEASRG